jgi:hypothetical protein
MRSIYLILLAISVLALAPIAAADPPEADAGDDQTVECADADDTEVELDGSGSSDPDDDDLEYLWESESFDEPVEGESPLVSLPLGVHEIELTVSDGEDTDSDTVHIRIRDTTPPEIELDGDSVRLWPPNHKYEQVDARDYVDSVHDVCHGDIDVDRVRFERVASDEDENGRGDGNTFDDIVLVDDCRAVDLRSERSGRENGRVYDARIVASDDSDNEGEASVEIAYVPHNRSRDSAVDDGTAYEVDDGQCEELDLCPEEPSDDCFETIGNGKAGLKIAQRGNQSRLRFGMKGVDNDKADFGDPTDDTDYQLCIYSVRNDEADDGRLEAELDARAGRSWSERRGGFRFRNRRGGELNGVLLQARDGGRGKIGARAQGDLGLPDLPVPDNRDVVVQLHNSDDECWSALFDDPKKNNNRSYKAISD